MGQYSMNAYDADIYIRQFKGLISNGNDPDGNLEYAVEAKNVDTTDGFLQPAADPAVKKLWIYTNNMQDRTEVPLDDILMDFSTPYWEDKFNGKTSEEIAALKEKYYRYYTGSTTPISSEEFRSKIRLIAKINSSSADGADLYIIACGSGFFYWAGEDWYTLLDGNKYQPLPVTCLYKQDGTVRKSTDGSNPFYEGWDMEADAESGQPRYEDLEWKVTSFQSVATHEDSEWNIGTKKHPVMAGYKYHFDDTALYLSSKRGLYVIQAYTGEQVTLVSDGGDYIVECYKIEAPSIFDHIESYGERLWGCCKDSLFYSAPYKPYDWQQNEDSPADGGGEIMEPNWDGDHFTGLRSFGNNLIAFKSNRAWKVTGVDIATMVSTEQYGFGTEFVDTVVSSGERLYMATRNGLAVYDGSTIRPLMQDNLRNLWSRIRQSAMDKMRAFLYENRKYCLAVPVDSDENNTLIVYDTIDGTVFFYEDMNIIGFLHPILAQEPIALWRDAIRSNMKQFDFNAWEKNLSGSRATKWMTPWIELGRKDIQKGGHDFYFTPEVKGENAVTFTISFQTEKKTKTKQYTVQPMTAAEIAAGKQGKTKRLHFGGTGRRFRIIIETPSGVDAGKAYKWRLYGGIHLITEIDKD